MAMHEGYLRRVLADGARRFSYRSGVGWLLGQPDAAYAMDFAPNLTPGFAFPHPLWKSDVIPRLPDGAFGPVPSQPRPVEPEHVEREHLEPGRMEPRRMDAAQSDAGRPPVDERKETQTAETSARWMAGLAGGQFRGNDRQSRPESPAGGGGAPEHAREDSGVKLVDNESGGSALIIPGYTEQRTSHADAAATGSSGPYPGSPSALPTGAFDDVGPGWRPAVLPGRHSGHGEEMLEGTFKNKPESGDSGRLLPSPMMSPHDVPRGFEPPRPYVPGPAESAVGQPAAARPRTPVVEETHLTPAQARSLPDLMIGNQATRRAEVDPSAGPVRSDGTQAKPSQATADAGPGSSGRPVQGVSRPELSPDRPAEAAASHGDEQDLTARSPRQPVPQILEVAATGEHSRIGSPAFWERRHLRRWQTGLLR